MLDDLRIICWPDPRLTRANEIVATFDDGLKSLAARMLDLMRQARGVGLAAPQVGVNVRLFVMNSGGEGTTDRVYVNPVFVDATGEQEAEEGCLSLPGVNANILRAQTIRLSARNLDGSPVEESAEGFIARIWQHEMDHLNGVLLMDRMSALARLGARKPLRELKANYEQGLKRPARAVAPGL